MGKSEMTQLTAERAKFLFSYDPATGELRWAQPTHQSIEMGSLAGTRNMYGYRQVCIDTTLYRVPRIIWLIMTGEWPKGVIDHIDRDTWNDRWSNLRDVTQAENRHNSEAKGITWCRRDNKWIAKIKNNGKSTYLGRFQGREDAIAAYQKAKADYLP